MSTTKCVTVKIPSVFFVAWIVMLALGSLHLDVDARIPAIGYLPTLLACWAVGLSSILVRRGFSELS